MAASGVLISIARVGQFFDASVKRRMANRLERTTKLHGRGCFIAEHRHLGRDKRMFENVNIAGCAHLMYWVHSSRTSFTAEAKSHTTIA
jgi:hypothetical protein